jgi:hypothetical protein
MVSNSFSHPAPLACAACPLNRRNFLARTGAATLGVLGALAAPGLSIAAESKGKTTVRIIYALHAPQQKQPDWPNVGFDFAPHMTRITNELGARCAGIEFIPSTATGEEEAKKLLEQDQAAGNIDGYLVYQMNCWNRVVQAVAASGKPVLYADFQYGGSGGFLVYNAAFLRAGSGNVGFVASSKMNDLVAAVKCFRKVKDAPSASSFGMEVARLRTRATPEAKRLNFGKDDLKCVSTEECLKQMKASKVLAIRGQEAGPAGEVLGIKVEHVPFSELNDAWKNADKEEAQAVADQWQKNAAKVEDVSRETLEASAAMYLAEKAVMKKHGANGITINCLGGFYGGHIHAYPCLGFHQLLNEGLIGGCECDVRSATTMIIGTILTQGRPGYISDPVIDTSKRQIIYAHCVAANKAFGPSGRSNPFEILTHSEDRQGASVRSLLPVGHMTTSLEFEPSRKEILFHRGLAVANDPDDRACRTKLCAEPVGDIEKLFSMWDQWGWHRVTFYGDLKEPIYALADAVGWKVVEEA